MASKKSLVIVESPAKANTINKYLGKDYVVKASLGHVKDLPKSKLGVDVDNDFEPVYDVIPGKEKVIKELRAAAKTADRIFLAADPDREGEAICQHLKEILDGNKAEVFRVLFNEITPKAIQRRCRKSRPDQSSTSSMRSRRGAFWIGLSAIRSARCFGTRSAAVFPQAACRLLRLRMIVEREREILAFKPEEYWSITAKLEGHQPPQFEAQAGEDQRQDR